MKYKFLIQSGILLALPFIIRQAYVPTVCFNGTNGHWAKAFVCQMTYNGMVELQVARRSDI
jgi:hypothetical protein